MLAVCAVLVSGLSVLPAQAQQPVVVCHNSSGALGQPGAYRADIISASMIGAALNHGGLVVDSADACQTYAVSVGGRFDASNSVVSSGPSAALDHATGTLGAPAATTASSALPAAAGPADQTADVLVTNNIVYRQVGSAILRLDAYLPADNALHPAVVLIHGGAWQDGDKSDVYKQSTTDVGRALAQAGLAAFSINYRLTRIAGVHAPEEIADVHAAVQWVRDNAAAYGVDPSRVAALGGSAGAQLAMMVATTGTPGQDRADVAVSWSGPTRLEALPGAGWSPAGIVCSNPTGCPSLLAFASKLVGCTPDACPDQFGAASPADSLDGNTSPIFQVISDQELIPLDQATSFDTELAAAGIPHDLLILPGGRHAFGYASDVIGPSIDFLTKHLPQASTPP